MGRRTPTGNWNGKCCWPLFQGTPSTVPVFSFHAYNVSIAGATFSRPGTATVVTAPDGLVETALEEEIRFENARREATLTTGVVTETVTVVSGYEYQVVVAGDVGAQVACSGAFTDTLVATAGQRISWPDGTPKTAATTSLTLTVTGTLTELSVYDVTGRTNQSPPEYVSVGVEPGPAYHGANVDGVQYFHYENGNTVDGNGVVAEAQGAALPDNIEMLLEPTATSVVPWGRDFTNWANSSNCTSTLDQVGIDGAPNSASLIVDNNASGYEYRYIDLVDTLAGTGETACLVLCLGKASTGIFAIQWGGAGGTIQFDPSDGDFSEESAGEFTGGTIEVIDWKTDWWKIVVSFIPINTGQRLYFHPARTTVLGNGPESAGTGSQIIDAVQMYDDMSHEEAKANSDIFTAGGPGIRAADSDVVWPGVTTPQAAGSMVFKGQLGFSAQAANTSLLGFSAGSSQSPMMRLTTPTWRSHDSTSFVTSSAATETVGADVVVGSRWSDTKSIGWSQGAWNWSPPDSYDGAFISAGNLVLGNGIGGPLRTKEVLLYDSDLEEAGIEGLLT